MLPTFMLCLFVSYLIGSIPFGLVLSKIFGLGDIRKIGSGNIGATNVLRTGRKGIALLTVLFDAGKAAAAAALTGYFVPDPSAPLFAGMIAILGHDFPVWLNFKGGKGVASTLGLMVYLTPVAGVCTALAWLLTALLFKYSSLSALFAMLMAPIYAFIFGECRLIVIGYALLAVLSFIKHRSNIKRLLTQEETKIKLKGSNDKNKGKTQLAPARKNRRRRPR